VAPWAFRGGLLRYDTNLKCDNNLKEDT